MRASFAGWRGGWVFALGCALCAGGAAAQDAEAPAEGTPPDVGQAAVSAEAGMFLPATIAPRTDSQRGYVRALGGYDSAQRSAQFEALADVTIIGPLAARVGVLYGNHSTELRPSVGLRLQALSQERQGFDLGVGVFYRPEGFTEAEGEIEVVLAFARRFGRIGTFANLIYGQDPEGAERDGEVRLAALYAITERFNAGLDLRLRVDLGSEEGERRREGGAEWDLVWGPTASYALGPVAVIAQLGMSLVGAEPARAGVLAMAGLAGAL